MLGLIGKKIGMTQYFDEDGKLVPVTVVEAGPVYVTQIKRVEKEGYNAVQVAFGEKKAKNVTKPLKGHFEKAGVENKRKLVEFRLDNVDDFTLGQEIKADLFTVGNKVDVIGTSKGKGTTGHIRRWNHSRGPETHGSKFHRLSGSKGGSSYPGRVAKGYKGPGRMGYERVTVANLEIVRIDANRNLMLIKGAIPGPKKGLVVIKPTVKTGK